MHTHAPLSEHVDALKRAFLQIFCMILAAASFLFVFSDDLIHFLSSPLKNLLPPKELHFYRYENREKGQGSYTLPVGSSLLSSEKAELKNQTLTLEPHGWAEVKSVKENGLYLFSPSSGLILALKVSFWGGIILSSPLWILPLLRFVGPALYPAEKALLFPFLALSTFCMVLGTLLAFYVTLPLTNAYFWGFNQGIGINLWGLEPYLDYTLNLLIAHALGFEAMVFLFFMIHLEFVQYGTLKSKRRHAIVISLILGALLTPPDILSQILLAAPLMGLYELALVYAKRVAKNRAHASFN